MEDDPGDREKYGVDIITIGDEQYEFMAHCDLWRAEVQVAIKELPDKMKLQVKYRNGKTGYYQVKTCKRN